MLLERLEHGLPVTAAERVEQHSMLVDDRGEVAVRRLSRRKYTRIRGAMLRQICTVWNCGTTWSTASWNAMSASTTASTSPAVAAGHHGELLRDRLEIGGGHHSSAFENAKRSSISRIGIRTPWTSSEETPSTSTPR